MLRPTDHNSFWETVTYPDMTSYRFRLKQQQHCFHSMTSRANPQILAHEVTGHMAHDFLFSVVLYCFYYDNHILTTVILHHFTHSYNHNIGSINYNKKAQLSLTNPRDACEKFARFT